MNKAILIFGICLSKIVFSISPIQHEVRLLYQKAAKEEIVCKQLGCILQPYQLSNDPVLTGYKACTKMIMANYVFNPINKLSYFVEGKNLLEKCIANNTQNIELRFLRFSIQTNTPSFLNYNNSIQEDKLILISSIHILKDQTLKQLILSFLLHSKYVSDKEKRSLIA